MASKVIHPLNKKSFLLPACPSAPRDLAVADRTNTTITVTWQPPEDNGGRDDVFYILEYRQLEEVDFTENETVFNTMYTITGLRPNTQYVIRVTAENGVCDQEPTSLPERRIQIVSNTTEGGKSVHSNLAFFGYKDQSIVGLPCTFVTLFI